MGNKTHHFFYQFHTLPPSSLFTYYHTKARERTQLCSEPQNDFILTRAILRTALSQSTHYVSPIVSRASFAQCHGIVPEKERRPENAKMPTQTHGECR
jgi:hypothetical protein